MYCGKVAEKRINKIPEKYPDASVDCYVIMPNHIHILLSIRNTEERGRGNPSPTRKTSVTAVMGWLKYQITKEINEIRETKNVIFQRSYYDHVVRDREDYYKIFKYIKENPLVWATDVLHTE